MDSWDALALFEAFLGSGLSLFLGIVLYPQRKVKPAGAAVWLLVISFGIWHVAAFFIDFLPRATGHEMESATLWKAVGYESLLSGYVMAAWILRLAWMS